MLWNFFLINSKWILISWTLLPDYSSGQNLKFSHDFFFHKLIITTPCVNKRIELSINSVLIALLYSIIRRTSHLSPFCNNYAYHKQMVKTGPQSCRPISSFRNTPNGNSQKGTTLIKRWQGLQQTPWSIEKKNRQGRMRLPATPFKLRLPALRTCPPLKRVKVHLPMYHLEVV